VTKSAQIYVALLDEGVDVWRPVMAERVRGDVYRIVDQTYDRETECWQFEPGEEVVCAMMDTEDGARLTATRRVSD
jgi:hypothetical protein